MTFREVECALADCVFNQPQSNLDCQFEPLPFENYNSLETGNNRNMNQDQEIVWSGVLLYRMKYFAAISNGKLLGK